MIFLKGYSIDLFKKFLEVFASNTDTGEMREILKYIRDEEIYPSMGSRILHPRPNIP